MQITIPLMPQMVSTKACTGTDRIAMQWLVALVLDTSLDVFLS